MAGARFRRLVMVEGTVGDHRRRGKADVEDGGEKKNEEARWGLRRVPFSNFQSLL